MSHRYVSHRVATQNRRLAPVKSLPRDPVKVAEACGVHHPGLIGSDSVDILDGRYGSAPPSASAVG